MKLWSEFPNELATKIDVVFSDLDDTISSEGKILPEAFNALWQLYKEGIHTVLITGRCAGWVDHLARMWPVAGVIGENGAFYAYMDDSDSPSKLKKRYYLSPEDVKASKSQFEQIKSEVFAKFPTCKVASDQPYREFDLAIDFCEDVPALSIAEVQEIVEIYEKYGATTKISSIHVNGWFGDYDKLTMAKIYTEERLGFVLDQNLDRTMFIGDSPNDQPMFSFFPNSIGVENINNFHNVLNFFPKYVTKCKSGLGFAEMVSTLIEKRSK
jgi:HAD superfamily hydrolase (TIGR01484 family)